MTRSALAKPPQAIDAAADDGPRKERGSVQSLERGFAILEEIACNREGISLAELSKRVGLHSSTTFHLVRTMVLLGYIRQCKDTKRYRVGPPLFTLAASSLDEVELVSLASPVLEDLSRVTGESGHFAIRSGDQVVVIAKTSGSGAFQMADRVGVARPSHCTALGKILLAPLTSAQLDRFLADHEFHRYTDKTITEPDALRREIEQVRRSGVAFDDGEFNTEVRCIAVPVYDFTGQVRGALGISGPIWRLSIQVLQDKVEQVKAAAARLSAAFGYRDAEVAGCPKQLEKR